MANDLLGNDFGIFYIISQFFALVALLCNLYAVQRRKKVQLLRLDTAAAICSTLHYLFLGAWSGVAAKSVSTVRNFIAFYEARCHKTSKLLPIIFVSFYVVIGMISFNSPFSLLPIIASSSYTIAIYISDISKIRYVALFATTLWLIYNIYVFSIVGIASDSIFIVNDLVAIYRYSKLKKHHRKHHKKSA